VDDPKQRRPDITKARSILGWEPKVARSEGLKITLDYFKSLPEKEINHKDFAYYNKLHNFSVVENIASQN
jgi:dTDP-glucose 4,6-dehydratase